jgi:insulysin
MLEFFKQYVHPASPVRAKLAIHLHAKGVSEAPTPVEQLPNEVTAAVEKGVDMSKIESNLTETASGVVPNGISSDSTATNGTAPSQQPYIIKDVREFRSRLPVSAGPQPVKDLSEFEELDSKL